MAERFHFNPDTGQTGRCDARFKCGFNQSDEQHGGSQAEAQGNYERAMEDQLFSNTKSAVSAADGPQRLNGDEIEKLKSELLIHRGTEWRDGDAQAAAIRHSLSYRGIDSSTVSSSELLSGDSYLLNHRKTVLLKVYPGDFEARADGTTGELMERRRIEEEARGLISNEHELYYDSDMADLRRGLELERADAYPIPSTPLNRFSQEQIDEERSSFYHEHGMPLSAAVLKAEVDFTDIELAERQKDGWITLNLSYPDEGTVRFSTEAAREALEELATKESWELPGIQREREGRRKHSY